jgi:hypothetical protein
VKYVADADDGSRLEIYAGSSGTQYVAETVVSTTIASAERTTLSRLQVEWEGLTWEGLTSVSSATLTISFYDFAHGVWVTIDGPRTGVTSDRRVTWVAPGVAGRLRLGERRDPRRRARDAEQRLPHRDGSRALHDRVLGARSYATSRISCSARSFRRLWLSICRIRSRVTLNARPTSSSVCGRSPVRP